MMILTLQCAYFGPFPHKHVELSDDNTMGVLDGIEGPVAQSGGRRKYRNTLVTMMGKETVSFVDKFMELDPRDRPSAQELLDSWLLSVVDDCRPDVQTRLIWDQYCVRSGTLTGHSPHNGVGRIRGQ